ncbi:hypothetical protein, partial [Bacteroides reticulotermitis]|uniref:hypothetical protein n=1 Tax=Bacteroides reticulotermitis TaxID=1133319 RepID=UPI001A7E25D1
MQQESAFAHAAGASTATESAEEAEFAVLLPEHEIIEKENAATIAAKKNFVFILSFRFNTFIFKLYGSKYSLFFRKRQAAY